MKFVYILIEFIEGGVYNTLIIQGAFYVKSTEVRRNSKASK